MLIKNSSGRYEIPGLDGFNKTLTCGSSAEIKLGDKWIAGCIEHDGVDYFFYTGKGSKIHLNESLELR